MIIYRLPGILLGFRYGFRQTNSGIASPSLFFGGGGGLRHSMGSGGLLSCNILKCIAPQMQFYAIRGAIAHPTGLRHCKQRLYRGWRSHGCMFLAYSLYPSKMYAQISVFYEGSPSSHYWGFLAMPLRDFGDATIHDCHL